MLAPSSSIPKTHALLVDDENNLLDSLMHTTSFSTKELASIMFLNKLYIEIVASSYRFYTHQTEHVIYVLHTYEKFPTHLFAN